jgi:inner membrane protein
MDTITHIALGACIGEAFLGKQFGKKAMIVGAVANSLPDIDFLAASWLSADENVLAHRGITHSFLFVGVMAALLTFICSRWFRSHRIPTKKWFAFLVTELMLHIIIDAFNAYGTGWFEPFNHYRVSFNTIFVADPLYSIWLGIAFIGLLLMRNSHRNRKWWTMFGLGLSSMYLLYCIINKVTTDADMKTALKTQHIHYTSYFSTPTPFNNLLWYIVAGNDTGFYTGYYTVLNNNAPINFHFFPRNNSLVQSINSNELKHLLRFSQGFYTIERWSDTLVFNDLRFGQMVGWQQPDAKFVFHYFLQRPGSNQLVLQRGRFEGWDEKATQSLIKRIKGK